MPGRSIAAVVFVALLCPKPVRADGLSGEWRAGPTRVEVEVQSWGQDCGQRPSSTTVPGGRTVRVSESGDDLTFSGRPARSTNGCWSENTAVRLVSRSHQGDQWTILCRTAADDPRAEVGTYTLRAAAPDRIEFRDQSRYDWQLNDSHCIATLTSTQTFERVATPSSTPMPAAEPTPEPAEVRACTPGPAARLSLRPGQSRIDPGERVCWNARVVDAHNCPVASAPPVRFELRSRGNASGNLERNCFRPASGAAGEGEFEVIARSGELEAQATVVVRTPDLSDLIARRAESLGEDEEVEGEAIAGQVARIATRAEGGGAWIWPVLVAAALMVVGLLFGIVWIRRRRRRAEAARRNVRSEAPPPAPADDTPKICPQCRRGYSGSATRCSVDDALLVRYADFVASGAGEIVCPKCGTRYPASTRFCGKDGTVLERV